MKRLNKFSRLPQEDQTLILNLCDKLPYKEVAEKLAQPREAGGLAFTTCASSLCKFYVRHHPEAVATEAVGQFASAVRINHQAHGEANFQAILSLVQNRLLDSLRAGRAIADLDKEFRTLQRVQKSFLADEKFRDKNHRTQEAYLDHIKVAAQDENEADFIDHTLEEDPGAGGATANDFQNDPTQLELDLQFARTIPCPQVSRYSTFLRAGARIVARRAAADLKRDFLIVNKVNPAFALPELENPTPASLLQFQQRLEAATRRSPSTEIANGNSTQDPSKTPAISTISTNFPSQVPKGVIL